ncbi:hypothetical protein [Nitratifractor sp.]
MRTLLFVLLLGPGLFATSPSKSWTLRQAREAAEAGKWIWALQLYRRIENPTDAIRLNEAKLLYRLGLYRKALKSYRRVEDPAYQAQKLYEMGNCLFRLGRPERAVSFYHAALKFGDLPEARYNLRIARKTAEELRRQLEAVAKKRRIEGLRKGLFEGSREWDDNVSEMPLEEAKLHEEIRRKQNRAARSGKGGESLREIAGEAAPEPRRTGSVEEGPTELERAAYERELRRREIPSLLIPMERSGE